jgi:hypothetical protein
MLIIFHLYILAKVKLNFPIEYSSLFNGIKQLLLSYLKGNQAHQSDLNQMLGHLHRAAGDSKLHS